MESFGLLRTNPNLTSNVKVVISDDKVYLESFDSSATLGDNRYKKVIIPEGYLYNKELSKFWKSTPIDIIFDSKDLEDFDIVYSTYDNQIDDIYLSGASNIKDTDYDEDFEYFAPLHIYPGNLPTDFIVFRVDGPGIIDLTSENFREEILDKMKVVKRFDLTQKTKLGSFIENSFNQGDLPKSAIDINFNIGEFTYWNGIDHITGEYISKSKIMNDEFKKEMTFTQGNDILTSGFKDNGVIYPFIINFKFLFNDIPATPDNVRKWSINRYYGYYGNLEQVGNVTPYKPPQLKTGMKLDSNKIFTLNGEEIDPFERGYKDGRTYYIEYNSKFYLISKVTESKFKIISDIDFPQDVDSNFNLNTISFGSNNEISYISGSTFSVDSTADVILIEIDGNLHRLVNDGSDWKILSDYKFSVTNNIFKYFIDKTNSDHTTVINLNDVDVNNPPKSFKIYQYNFNAIKDFDLNILDTDFSKFEYEFEEDITNTEEPKLYENDLSFSYKDKVIQKYLYKNKVVSIPTSEYLATSELYEVNPDITRPNGMFTKNIKYVKWGIDGSLSNNDYPYMFNINQKADPYNRTTDVSELIPDRQSRNEDYFYTFCDSNYNFGYTSDVIYQSLSIINDSGFEVDKYFNNGTYSTDYFDEIFNRNETFNEQTKPIRKYSNMIKGDAVSPNITVFKGLNIYLYEVDSVLTDIINDTKVINSLNVKGTNKFENYKFSIILSNLNKDPDEDFNTIDSTSDWKPIKKWARNTSYSSGDIVLFEGFAFKDANGNYGFNGYGTESATGSITPEEYTYPDGTTEILDIDATTNLVTTISATGPNNGIAQLFECTANTIVTDPTLTLVDDPNWDLFPIGYRSIFYSPNNDYQEWDPITASYSYLLEETGLNVNYLSYFVYYRGEYYKCVKDQTAGVNKSPDYVGISIVNGLQVPYWERVNEYLTTTNYDSDEIVTQNGSLYYYNNSNQSLSLIHTFEPVAETPYNLYKIINFNGNFYTANKNLSLLDTGINVYINKKWRNILVQIYFNDNIVPTFNVKRDDLYSSDSQQIVASNFIEILNSLTLLNGFVNPINYYIIEQDGSFTKYDLTNIEDIPYILQIEGPVEIEVFSHSLNLSEVDINKSILKPTKVLENNELISVDQIDYYNNSSVAYRYDRLDIFGVEDKTDILYRFNGLYSPIFNDINIFNKENDNRYVFNESLLNFGEIKEMIKSKVGDENLLRIKDDSYKSVFPQVDEIGYFIDSHNIFKSTWDTSYYKKTIRNI